MSKISFKGQPITTVGELPAMGSKSPEFVLVDQELKEVRLQDFIGKKKILNIFPSLDTGVCAQTVREFCKACEKRDDAVLLNISKDLPFASSRFCKEEGLKQCLTLSAFRSPFAQDYGLEIKEGPLKGLCSRAVLVLDKDNKVVYSEQVPEIVQEPFYQNALDALNNC